MIIRRLTLRHGRQALTSSAAFVPRTPARCITHDTSTKGLTPETIETLTAEAALSQIPGTAAGREVHPPSNRPTDTPRHPDNPADTWRNFRRLQKRTTAIGSHVERRQGHRPKALLDSPPSPSDVTLELLMAAQTHMGHHTSRWNPANARYIYGARQGIHLISLESTAAHLRRAARVVEEVTANAGIVLFVGTRPGHQEIVTRAASLAGACHLFTKWTPGAITNRDVILRDREVRIVNGVDGPIDGFERHLINRRPIVPDLVVCLNPLENYTMLYECGLGSVPTIGVIDTDADPSWVTYQIPANDDSLRSVAVVGGVLGRAGEIGQKRRLAAAEQGVVKWETPTEVLSFMHSMRNQWDREYEKWERTVRGPKNRSEGKPKMDHDATGLGAEDRALAEQAMTELEEAKVE